MQKKSNYSKIDISTKGCKIRKTQKSRYKYRQEKQRNNLNKHTQNKAKLTEKREKKKRERKKKKLHSQPTTFFRMTYPIFPNPGQDGGGGQKDPPTSLSPVTSTRVGISPKNFLTFSFKPFAALV